MFRKIKTFFLFVLSTLFFSCISEDSYECGIYLEFLFTHNMEYANSFNPQVKSVDIFVFDESGVFLFTRRSECETDLVDYKRMYLNDGLSVGNTYQILTIGNLCELFCFSNGSGVACAPGVTTIEEVRLALEYESDKVSHEFPHLWFGEPVEIEYLANQSVFHIPLVRNTNNFTFVLSRLDDDSSVRSVTPLKIPYTFEIVTPEGAMYGYDNAPLSEATLRFRPHRLTQGTTPQSLSVGHLNTMRLFDVEDDYRLIIRSTHSGREVWNYDLMYLLRETKPFFRPDDTPLSMQEYLDRRGEWEIIILHQGGEDDENGFLAVGVEINNWILWLHDIDL